MARFGSSRWRALGPRHLRAAARTAAVITIAGTVITALFAFVAPSPDVPGWANAISPLVLAGASLGLWRGSRQLIAAICTLMPLVGVGLVVGLDLATHDSSAAGQAFFSLPVLYAGSQFKTAGASTVTLAAVGGTAAVAFSFESTGDALTDVSYVGLSLVLMTVVLVYSGRVQDRLTAKLAAQAAIDPLTGLVTRRVLDDATRTAISSSVAHTGITLILVDIDRFKSINDTYGHPVGDEALTHVAHLLTTGAHPEDIVARMGGDELAVLLPACTYPAAVARATEVVDVIRSRPLILADGSEVAISVSAGVAHVPEHAFQVRDLYASADTALYEAKRAGRDRVGRVPPTPREETLVER